MLLVAALGVGCGQKTVDEIGYGTLEKGVYHNAYLDLEMVLPETWTVQSGTVNNGLVVS